MSPAATQIAVVASRWHHDIVDRAVDAFCREIAAHGNYTVDVITVSGAFEIPLRVQRLTRAHRYAAIATCAFVIDGGIYRHEYVAATVLEALMRIQLAEDHPVYSAVLTPHAFHGHDEHVSFFGSHFAVKGRELAAAVVEGVRLDAAQDPARQAS